MRRHAEPARGNLLDLGYPVRTKAIRILTTLTTVRARANLIHSHCQRFMRFRGQSPQRHAGRIEAAQDLIDRLDLLQRDRRFGEL